MGQSTLKTLRILIPGFIILILAAPLLWKVMNIQEISNKYNFVDLGISTFAAIVLGSLYYISNLRNVFTQHSLKCIHENIKDNLLNACISNPQISSKVFELKRGKKLIEIFYHYIDNDESLKVKAYNVRLNGLIWTSIGDFMIIGLFSLPVYTLAYIFLEREHYIWIILVVSIILITCFMYFMPRITKRHIELSTEQLNVITTKHRQDLCQRISEAIK